MQFKNPEILYLLFLLIIPILIHLFQLQKFEKVAFTNVKLLKQIEQQTRKSSKLKKLLILLSRLLLFTALIMAFAQPYYSANQSLSNVETIIYLDNSLSMQAKGEKGELLQKSKHDLINSYQNAENTISLITNNNLYKDLELSNLKNVLLKVGYSPLKRDIKTILLQIDNLKNNKEIKNRELILISDFQSINGDLNTLNLDSLASYNFVQENPNKTENVSVDSVWFGEVNFQNLQVKALITSHQTAVDNLNISLFLDNKLFGKTTVSLEKNKSEEIVFSIPNSRDIVGKFTLNDNQLLFDNTFYFAINKEEKTKVLAIGEANPYLSKIYTEDEFNFVSFTLDQLDYSLIPDQNLIVLNSLLSFPNSLISTLQTYVQDGGHLVIIPNSDSDIGSYNNLFSVFQMGTINEKVILKKSVTTINYKHPFFKNVFRKEVKNFQYPTVNIYYPTSLRNASYLLRFDDQSNFISEINSYDSKVFWFASPLDLEFSNFTSSPLVVPTFYNFANQNQKQKELYFTVGEKNEFVVKSITEQETVLHISNDKTDFIPLQSKTINSIKIQTELNPLQDGIYQITNNNDYHKNIAFNYNREESKMKYSNINSLSNKYNNVNYFDSIENALTAINDQYKKHSLWHLFIIFALMFLGIEIILQKFLKI
jgi:hypothetical protein